MTIPSDFIELLPKLGSEKADDPVYYLWVYDPQEDVVHVEHNASRHKAEAIDHGQLGEKYPHPARVHGYAYPIRGGYRITDWEHRAVADPHIAELVRDDLRGNSPTHRTHHGNQSQLRAVK